MADGTSMDFQGTPLNMTTLLVVALAALAAFMMLRKRYDSNLPLIFYFIAVVFTNASDRGLNPFLLYSGLAFALLLRFEFLNTGFSKVVSFLATGSICLIMYTFLAEVFGDGQAPF